MKKRDFEKLIHEKNITHIDQLAELISTGEEYSDEDYADFDKMRSRLYSDVILERNDRIANESK